MLAAFGGIVGHLVDVSHSQVAFSWKSFFIAVLVAFFVGQVLGTWLPGNVPGRDGILMVAGTSGYPLLVIMQERIRRVVEQTSGGG